jgi:NADH-quinone oxidoreductase subunit M
MTHLPILTLLTLTPVVGALVVFVLGGRSGRRARNLALGFGFLALLEAALTVHGFDTRSASLQFVERHPWIPALGVDYFVAVDGLGLLMVLLSALLVPLSIGVSSGVKDRPGTYYGLILLLQSGLFGAFTALNFFHWFLFWELSLVPSYFLVLFWGGPDRRAAATQFFVYTFAGSVAMLLSMQAVFLATGTFDLPRLADLARSGELARAIETRLHWTGLGPSALGMLLFGGVFLGLAVKVPLMPFHTWLPATYAEAPSAIALLLTGALSKMGVYGFLRILAPIFPGPLRAAGDLLMVLAVLTVVASAFAAFAQKDLKRMLAYSSINHLGLCLLGLFATFRATGDTAAGTQARVAAIDGVLLQMFNHGLTAAALFGFIALLEKRSGGLRGIDDFGGLRRVAPVFAGLMGLSLFSSLGLPGLNGFLGEFLIFQGAFPLAPVAAALSTLGLLLTALFLLTAIQRVFAGPLNPRWADFPDLTRSELAVVAPAVALMLVLGVAPQLILRLINPTVLEFVHRLGP